MSDISMNIGDITLTIEDRPIVLSPQQLRALKEAHHEGMPLDKYRALISFSKADDAEYRLRLLTQLERIQSAGGHLKYNPATGQGYLRIVRKR